MKKKIRIWDYNINKMVIVLNVDKLTFDNDTFQSTIYKYFLNKLSKKFDIMESVSKDENNKEIFELDIVTNNEVTGYVTRRGDGRFIIVTKNGDIVFEPEWRKYKVIGNLYENTI